VVLAHPRVAVCVVAVALALPFTAVAGAGPVAAPDFSVYSGLGTWIDIYSPTFGADPDAVAAAVANRGVRTVYVETGNFRQRVDVVRASWVGRLIEAAHDQGISVVAWYLPSLTNVARDLRRSLAAAELRTSDGDRFDSFALDIESSAVRGAAERNRRLLALSRRLRAAVGPDYPLGAIIPSPVGMQLLPRYWPTFPYRELGQVYDVFLPMAYFSYRASDRAAVARYITRSVSTIRLEAGAPAAPIHVIGGLAGATGQRQATGFVQAVAACRVLGFSLYDFFTTKRTVWPLLSRAAHSHPGGRCG
jgi:hypothetical protein